jgi:hypothetical protein
VEKYDPLQQVISPIEVRISCNDLQAHDLLCGVYWPDWYAVHDFSVIISTTEKDLEWGRMFFQFESRSQLLIAFTSFFTADKSGPIKTSVCIRLVDVQ